MPLPTRGNRDCGAPLARHDGFVPRQMNCGLDNGNAAHDEQPQVRGRSRSKPVQFSRDQRSKAPDAGNAAAEAMG